ncbi:MarR family winged helix-turn-helix transcriptional regulator [Amycolatopsis mediterranei]|uniref:MarR family winged helix-turn-helix transcriptional regulator n=1 Tax=Amycolatopsis mediterranei TaxID=33910 RepID=UPI00343D8FA0
MLGTMPEQRTAFETLDQDGPLLGPLVRKAYRWYRDGVQSRLALQGDPALSMGQFELFAQVDWDGTSIAELARRMGTTRQSAHQAVRELVQADLLEVGPDPSSARSKLVRPTARAADRLRAARKVLVELEDELAKRLGLDRVEQLREILGADWGTPLPRDPG